MCLQAVLFRLIRLLRKSGKGYLLVLIYCRLTKQCNALQIVGIKTALNENHFKGMCL
mgnify:FL=1